ncbi:non-ribosomal peptide synthetase [Biformimicrobium ophioploci]|uniref:Carrier domain-containing protein n=1 Tax=Biformimicrobium ophioploci TaxID=3036711 RepID=A0ABQ6M073_9GAMM|nr:non-ribosomal peptide synthetase [Microbulbifer sp. NKW57]GMG87746.1 hypothetical protein MNKW57_20670 [Microbulbifer sp. NKW57]
MTVVSKPKKISSVFDISEVDQTLASKFEKQVDKFSDRLAVTDSTESMTYAALNQYANRVARSLQGIALQEECPRIGLYFEKGIQFIASVLGVLKAGYAYVPIDPAFPGDRNRFIVEDSGISICITNSGFLAEAQSVCGNQVEFLEIEGISELPDAGNPEQKFSPDRLAFILYTSGSTGRPKGVMHSHRTMLHATMRRTNLQKMTEEDRVSLLYSCSVMGNAVGLYTALLNGASVFPYELNRDGIGGLGKWLQTRKITVFHTIATVFREFGKLSPAEGGYQVRLAIFGGERVLKDDVLLARKLFSEDVEFYTGLGATETGTVRYFRIDKNTELEWEVVPIGYPVEDMEILLLNEEGEEVSEGELGEIVVRSPYVALGYWNDDEATGRVFGVRNGVRTYSMGDMALMTSDGMLVHQGRRDFQVTIRGYRVELGDVECALLSLPEIADAIVMSRAVNGDVQLVAYIVWSDQGQPGVSAIRAKISEKLPPHMVPGHFVLVEALPRTPNNKVDRLALPEPTHERLLTDVGSGQARTIAEIAVLDICAHLLRRDRIGLEQNFFDLGGHSLVAGQLVAALNERFGIDCDIRIIFDAPDLVSIARYVDGIIDCDDRTSESEYSVPERRDPLEPSDFQAFLWRFQKQQPNSRAYHLSNSIWIRGALDVDALEWALASLIVRHEALRTVFPAVDGRPVQRIEAAKSFELTRQDVAGSAEAVSQAQKVFNVPFDLEAGPLWRFVLLRVDDSQHLLVAVFHHLVYDNFRSSEIFFSELDELYEARTKCKPLVLAPLSLQFADYCIWLKSRGRQRETARGATYWSEMGELPDNLQVPPDTRSTRRPEGRGGRVKLRIPRSNCHALVELARSESVTPFMLLLATWQLLLQRYTGQDDILVSTPMDSRLHPGADGLIGCFLNSLVLRTDISDDPTFGELLARSRTSVLEAFERERAGSCTLTDRDFGSVQHRVPTKIRNFFIYRQREDFVGKIGELETEPVVLNSRSAKYDLTLSLLQEGDSITGTLEYSFGLYSRKRAEQLARHFCTLLDAAIANRDLPVSRLQMYSASELGRFFPPPRSGRFADDRTVAQLFEQRTATHPDRVALIAGDISLSFKELNARANRLARYLREHGAGPDTLVAVCMKRSADLVTTLMAVFKAGAAYVPMDPAYPSARLQAMLDDCGAGLLVTEAEHLQKLSLGEVQTLILDKLEHILADGDGSDLFHLGKPSNLAYVIYTSGSTGRPKGVQIEQGALVNFLGSMADVPGIADKDVVQAVTTVCFDIAMLEIFLPLVTGARLIISPRTTSMDPALLARSMEENGVTIMQATPVTWRMLLEYGWKGTPGLKVLCGGEAMGESLAEQLIALDIEVWNLYGPTETTIWSSVKQVQKPTDALSIGYPIACTDLVVLSKHGSLQPDGVPGELLIGGRGLARGYLNREALTREKFIQNPWKAGELLYRTGDLATRLGTGEFRMHGRIDTQIKIRGYRVELQEIEAVLDAQQDIRQSVVVVRGEEERKQLVAYVLLESRGEDPSQLRKELRKKLGEVLPEYMVPSAFIAVQEFPYTANGKVDRKALTENNTDGYRGARSRPPKTWHKEEGAVGSSLAGEILLEICSDLLGRSDIALEQNFFDIGGHSLVATQLLSRLNRLIGCDLGIIDIFEAETLGELATHIEDIRSKEPISSEVTAAGASETRNPLNAAQRGIWFSCRMLGGNAAYNIVNMLRLRGELNIDALHRGLTEIVRRHRVLDSIFPSDDNGPWQELCPAKEVELEVQDLTGEPAAKREARAMQLVRENGARCFMLDEGPLYSFRVIKLSDREYFLSLVFHHIIYDHSSSGVLFRELAELYQAFQGGEKPPLAELPLQFSDHVAWEVEQEENGALDSHIAYWHRQLDNLPPYLELVTDRPRPKIPSYRGGLVRCEVPDDVGLKLSVLARGERSTHFMVMLSAWYLLLYRRAGQADLIVGTSSGRRYRPETENLIGCFINNLVLRTDLSGSPAFVELMQRVRRTVLDACSHDRVPFGRLVEDLNPRREMNLTPFFQHMFLYHNAAYAPRDLPGVEVTRLKSDTKRAKYDLLLQVREESGRFSGVLEYSEDLFDRTTAQAIVDDYLSLLCAAVKDPHLSIDAFAMAPDTDEKILPVAEDPNRKQAAMPSVGPMAGTNDDFVGAVIEICRDVTGCDSVEGTDNFFDIGGHSLTATQLLTRLNRRFSIDLKISEIFETDDMQALGRRVREAVTGTVEQEEIPLQAIQESSFAPASSIQRQLWTMEQIYGGSGANNVASFIRICGDFDAKLFHKALNAVVARHDVLRTTLISKGDRLLQRVSAAGEVAIAKTDLSCLPQDEREQRARTLFNTMLTEPLSVDGNHMLRCVLYRMAKNEVWVGLSFDHSIFDRSSLSIFLRELDEYYGAFASGSKPDLPPLEMQYSDFSRRELQRIESGAYDTDLEYWKGRLANLPDPLMVPGDRRRPEVASARCGQMFIKIPSDLLEAVDKLAREARATRFMLMLSAWQILLQRYSGRDDILVGTPSGRRQQFNTEKLVGCFLNNLVLRTDLSGNPPYIEALKRTRKTCIEALTNDEIPFGYLIDKLAPSRQPNQAPFFQHYFVYQSKITEQLKLGGLDLELLPVDSGGTAYDLSLYVVENKNTLSVAIEYRTDLYNADTVGRMLGYYLCLLRSACQSPENTLWSLEMLAPGERDMLATHLNNTEREFPVSFTVSELVERKVEQEPQAIAVVGIDETLTYATLNGRANQLAAYLQTHGVKPETLIGVCMDRTSYLIVALLAVQKAGAAFVPIDPEFPRDRIQMMLDDAKVDLLLSDRKNRRVLDNAPAPVVEVGAEASIFQSGETSNLAQPGTPDNLAYIIYTSGSTGKPKGVQITQRALVNFLSAMQQAPGISTKDVIQGVTTVCFDIAMLEIFLPLVSGARLVFSDRETATNPQKLAASIEQHDITMMQATPVTWRLLLQSGWQGNPEFRVLCGGEAMGEDLAEQLLARKLEVWNLYGPTETTIWSAVERISDPVQARYIGAPIANTQFLILGRNDVLQPFGVPGELHIGGEGLARGYLDRPELNADKFVSSELVPARRLYRTGDLAVRNAEGRIEFLGRMDNQVKVNGFRIETGEIEVALARLEDVIEVAVVARDIDSEKRLVAYIVTGSGELPDPANLRTELRKTLPVYMIPGYYVAMDSLPKTQNNKVDRKGLPEPRENLLQEATVDASNDYEREILSIAADILARRDLGINHNMFELGGHSLSATRLNSRIRERFQVDLPVRDIFEASDFSEIAARVEQLCNDPTQNLVCPLSHVSRELPLAASSAQKNIWLACQLNEGQARYNVATTLVLEGSLDTERLQFALEGVVRRHEVLRTTFYQKDDALWQQVKLHVESTLHMQDVGIQPNPDAAAEQVARDWLGVRFNLERGPLFRFGLVRVSDTRHWLVLVFHHIIFDQNSGGIFLSELEKLYSAEQSNPPNLAYQFTDYAAWEQRQVQSGSNSSQLDYWKNKLQNLPDPLLLPQDKRRPQLLTYSGGRVEIHFPTGFIEKLHRISGKEKVTSFMVLLAGWQLLLHRYSGRDDVIVGTPASQRNHSAVEPLIGCLINNLVLRTDLSGNPSFQELVERVREVALDAFANSSLTFDELLAEIRPDRQANMAPIFQHMFVHYRDVRDGCRLGEARGRLRPLYQDGVKYDLTLAVSETDDTLHGLIEYSDEIFSHDTVVRMGRNFIALLNAALENPEQQIWSIPAMPEDERCALLETWRGPEVQYSPGLYTHHLVEQAGRDYPDSTALVTATETLDYATLLRRANQVAAHLLSLGAGAGTKVAVCLDRTAELPVALLAVMKCGAAYIPVDPYFPADRLATMLEDSQPEILVTCGDFQEKLSQCDSSVVLLEPDSPIFENQEAEKVCVSVFDESPAFFVYTSGSTGKPKGTVLTHAGLRNLLFSLQERPGVTREDVFLAVSTISFDAATMEIFLPLVTGARLLLRDRNLSLDPGEMARRIEQDGVTAAFAVPAIWRALVENGWRGGHQVKILTGGEATGGDVAEQLVADGHSLWSVYAPSETTVISMLQKVERPSDTGLLGRPINNTGIYILGRHDSLCPVGVPGELHIGGVGVGLGYLNREQLTEQRYLKNPHVPGERLYRTGDIAVRLPDGNVRFLGRVDHQVKIRGVRIELGEIEQKLSGLPMIGQSVVTAIEADSGQKVLVAYVVNTPGHPFDDNGIKQSLRKKLPEYMVPSQIIAVDEMPKTNSGKIDRNRLPPPDMVRPEDDQCGISEGESLETVLSHIFCSVLKTKSVSADDSFFDLGGHSLQVFSVIDAINSRYGLGLQPALVFDYPSVGALSEKIGEILGRGAAPSEQKINSSARDNDRAESVIEALSGRGVPVPVEKERSFGGMRTSWIARKFLAPVYEQSGPSIRKLVKRAILRLEGGHLLSTTMRYLFARCHDITVGEFSYVPFNQYSLRNSTKIGKFCSISDDVQFLNAEHPRNTLSTHAMFYHASVGFSEGYELDRVKITVGNDVFIAPGARILYPTRNIGDGAVIAADAVVVEDVPPYAVVAGSPARVVRYRFSEQTRERLCALKWWDRPIGFLQRHRDQFMQPLEGEEIR